MPMKIKMSKERKERCNYMKKILIAVLIIVLFLGFVFWKFDVGFFIGKPKLQEMSFTADGGATLIWQDRNYKPYGIPDSVLIGDAFGKVKNEKYMRVYLCWDQDPEEWLILVYSTVMSEYMLYKEESVTEIPDGFEALD